MNFEEFEHIIRAAANICNEKEFIVIGSQAILASKPDIPRELRTSIIGPYPKNPRVIGRGGTVIKRDPEPSYTVDSAGIKLHEFSSHQTRA
jgi:hypothetical protein